MSASTPKVSIVLSAYNNADSITAAVESLRRQTLADWELVVINDGSRDETPNILDRLAAADGRIRVVHQENTGLTRALIRGCQEAQADYIARQDADDVSMPERLAEQAALLDRRSDVGFVSCWTLYVAPGGEVLEELRRPDDPSTATRRLLSDREGPPAHGSVMFRKTLYESVGGYRPEFYYAQDADLWMRMAEHSLIGYVPKALYSWTRDPEGISGALRDYQRRFGELGQSAKQARLLGNSDAQFVAKAAELTREVIELRRSGAFKRGRSVSMSYMIGSQLAQRGDPRASRYLWKVIRRQPWHWKAWVRLMQAGFRSSRNPSSTLPHSNGTSG